jgi:HD superfamily phosphohydrolase
MMMDQINQEMNGQLNLAIKIYKDEYPKRFMHQLISSQLDVDRLDYLRRDSFFTGVTEGNIGSARIIKMLNVVDDRLVVEQKGIYSIENYLTSRRLMYWQVYLHKATVAYEKVLVNVLLRAKHLARQGVQLFATPALRFFLYNDVDASLFHAEEEALANYEMLDDNDIWSSVKTWTRHEDKILSILSRDLVERRLFHVEIREEPISTSEIEEIQSQLAARFDIPFEDAAYLMSVNTIQKDMYDINDDHITILFKDGSMKDIAEASEILNVSLLSKKIRKYYLCYHKN